jgi:undecaprenyl diphosphate synthase
MVLTVAFDYGSRTELLRAAQRSIAESDRGEPISPETVQSNLYNPELPDVDLLIRTSGESRISNFLLWQISNAQVYFTERSWPDLDAAEIDAALALIRT